MSTLCNTLFKPGWTLLLQKWKIYIYITLPIPWSGNAGARDKEQLDCSLTSVLWILVFKILEMGSSLFRYLNFFALTADDVHFTTLILIKDCEYCTQDNRARDHKLLQSLRPGILSPNWSLFHPFFWATIIYQHSTVTLYFMSSFETVSSASLHSSTTLSTSTTPKISSFSGAFPSTIYRPVKSISGLSWVVFSVLSWPEQGLVCFEAYSLLFNNTVFTSIRAWQDLNNHLCFQERQLDGGAPTPLPFVPADKRRKKGMSERKLERTDERGV